MLIDNPPVEIVPDLWMLGTREYPLYYCRGDQADTLLEGGIGASAPLLARQFDELGFAAERLRQIVVTHAHPDHVMAVAALRELFPQARVLASATAARTMASEKAMALFGKLDAMLLSSLVSAGRIEQSDRPQSPDAGPLAVDVALAEGDRVEIAPGRSLEVLETPGHSACSLSFFDRAAGVLIISDATGYYLPEAGCWWPNYFTDYGQYVASIERLASLEAEVLCLSHNAALRGREAVRDYFRDALAATKQYHERIVAEIAAGKPERELAETLGAEVYARTTLLPLDFFQKNCALLVKLSLQHETPS